MNTRNSPTVGIIDSSEARFKLVHDNLSGNGFEIAFSLKEGKLTNENVSQIQTDVLFVHINDLSSTLKDNLRMAPCKLVFVYSGGSLPFLTQDEASSGKVFNISYSVDRDGTVDDGKKPDVLTAEECNEIKSYLKGKSQAFSFVQGRASTLGLARLKILTPFVLLYQGIETEQEGAWSFANALKDKKDIVNESQSDQKSNKKNKEKVLESLKRGKEFLSNPTEIEKRFYELMGISYPVEGEQPDPLVELKHWLKTTKSDLAPLFDQAIGGQTFYGIYNNPKVKLDRILAVINWLKEIIEFADDYGKWQKKNSSMRHFLKNAITRLTNYTAPLNKELRQSLDREIKDIEEAFQTFRLPSESYEMDQETKNESKSGLEAVRKFRGKLVKGEDDYALMEELKKLVAQFEAVIVLTHRAPKRIPMNMP